MTFISTKKIRNKNARNIKTVEIVKMTSLENRSERSEYSNSPVAITIARGRVDQKFSKLPPSSWNCFKNVIIKIEIIIFVL